MTMNMDAGTETSIDYGQIVAVLLRRKFWLIGGFFSVLAIAVFIALTAEPSYKSYMQLLVEPNYQGKKEGGGAESQFADTTVQIDYATQLNLMRSSQLIQRAVDLLRPEYPTISIAEIKSALLLNQVSEGKTSTNIFQATYTDSDPVKAQKVLQAMQKVYKDYNQEQQKQRLERGLSFINDQLPTVRRSVIKAESNLEKFRKNQNLIDPGQQSAAIATALNAIEQERRVISVQYQESQARYKTLQEQLSRSPQDALLASRLSQSPRYQALLNEIQKTELALAQERLRFADSWPPVQKLLDQRKSQLALLQAEAARVLGESDSSQVPDVGDRLLTEGQYGSGDQGLTSQLIDTQTALIAMRARDQSLAQVQQQLRTELNRFPGLLAEYDRLQPEVDLNRGTLQQLLKAKQELGLEIARGGFDWQVVESPRLGASAASTTGQTLMLGAIAGLMLGGLAAFGRELMDDAVHSSDDLKKQVSLPLLGITPALVGQEISEPGINLPFRRQEALAPSTTQVVYWPPFRESLDLIYKNIQLLSSAFPFNSLVITSALAGEGKSTLALGLAVSAARLHQRVLLIDADLRRPSLHKLLNLPNHQGLSTLLASDTAMPSQGGIHPSGSYIDILTSGPTPTDPAKLLSSRRMAELMAMFEQNYDLVLLDAPPVLGMVDAILAASFCSGVVMVGRIGRVTRSEVAEATAMLNKLNVIGVVANGATNSTNSYSSYGRTNRESTAVAG
ncbi:polysaccharide biosynthesis tyrosine autokinase [Leptolyngbya sp. FACHB-261]|uniref:GumC family protein n=1 Tax=Leptolyngbya sp. FACHB-261 TaxID=2692806 RepID=UPI0016843572|nr:polysaccharide biosynthesis tyrosine autokinase [Leptolyngbya sp. FACHB-261]MBD2101140.1 polysaccharide biosynthesis tyrosine autokinase [Leptolyngbya sp. FACHB-261]